MKKYGTGFENRTECQSPEKMMCQREKNRKENVKSSREANAVRAECSERQSPAPDLVHKPLAYDVL